MTTTETTLAVPRATTDEPAHFGHKAVIVAGVVGFGLGLLVAAAFVPLLSKVTPKHHDNAGPTPQPYTRAQVMSELHTLAVSALGKYGGPGPMAGKTPLESIRVLPVMPIHYPGVGIEPALTYDATLRFFLAPSTIGPKYQIGLAESNCFSILQAIYTHDLPVENIDLYGDFQFPHDKRPTTVLHAGSDLSIEMQLNPWQDLHPTDEAKVWAALRPHWISRRFRTYQFSP